jgi:hypothetical protein
MDSLVHTCATADPSTIDQVSSAAGTVGHFAWPVAAVFVGGEVIRHGMFWLGTCFMLWKGDAEAVKAVEGPLRALRGKKRRANLSSADKKQQEQGAGDGKSQNPSPGPQPDPCANGGAAGGP